MIKDARRVLDSFFTRREIIPPSRSGLKESVPPVKLAEVQAVIFDFYDTVVLDDVVVSAVWQHINELGYRCTRELQQMFEPDAFDGSQTPHCGSALDHDTWCRNNWRSLLTLSGVPETEVDSVLAAVLMAQTQYVPKLAPMALELVALLRQCDLKVGLCSNWESPIDPILSKVGLDPSLFDAITISAEVGARKPHAAIFQDVCKKLSILPQQGVFVGDNWNADIVGAVRAGFLPIWITHGRPTKGLDHLIAEFESLASFHAFAANCLTRR